MANPKVTIREQDQSTKVPSVPGVTGAIVIPALKGPVNEPTLVSSDADLLRRFTPNETVSVGMHTSFFSALAFLEKSNGCYIIRAANAPLFGGVGIKTLPSSTSNFSFGAGVADTTAYVFDGQPDAPAVQEITELTYRADVSGDLNNKAHTLSAPEGDYYVWFNVNAAGVDPALTGTGIEVALATNSTADAVASAVQSAVDLLTPFGASVNSNVVTVTNATGGDVADAADVDIGGTFSVSVAQQGVDEIDQADECLAIFGTDPGAYNNDIGVKIISYTTQPSVVKEPDSFIIEVYKSSNLSTPVESHLCSRIVGKNDGFGNNIYVEDVLESSQYISARSNPAIDESIQPKDQASILFLGSGDDGAAVTDSEIIEALQPLKNNDAYTFKILMDGGWATPAVALEMDTIVKNRKDSVAIHSVPYSAESSANYLADVLEYRNVTLNLDSSYSSLYTPHVKIFDRYNNRNLWASPDGYAAAAISETSANYEIWFAPAGNTRGSVNALDVRRKYTDAERDALYDAGLNPIKFQPGKGLKVWGQKTLQVRPTALDRLNVRLLLTVVEPSAKEILEDFLFEPNNEPTRARAKRTLDDLLGDIQTRQGLTDFLVVIDESNNTPTIIDQNKMVVDIYLKPVRVAEFIQATVTITASGVDFQALV